MRYSIILFFYFLLTLAANAQTISSKVDSTTKSELAELHSRKSSHYDSIMYKRSIDGMYQRIDTLQYDYVFITESSYKRGTEFSFEETYIYKKDSLYYSFNIESPQFDSMPSAEYIINEKAMSNLPMDTEWFFQLLRSYQEIKPFQKAHYDKIQERHLYNLDHGFFFRKLYHWDVKKEIKNTWQIESFIEKENGVVKVSIQNPPRHPRFKLLIKFYIADF